MMGRSKCEPGQIRQRLAVNESHRESGNRLLLPIRYSLFADDDN